MSLGPPNLALLLADATVPSRLDLAGKLLGRLHPLIVHFPIALLLVAALFELFRLRKSHPGPSATAIKCLALGAFAAAAAAAMGWLNADYEITGIPSQTVTIHRWLGIAAAAGAFVTLAAAAFAAKRPQSSAFWAYRFLLIATATVVGIGGHYGGRLTYGDTYISDAIAAVLRGASSPASPPTTVTPAPADPNSLEARALAILDTNCLDCHGGRKTKGGLSIADRSTLLRGGKNGPAVTPGNADTSLLVDRIVADDPDIRMPQDADPLKPEDIKTLEDWIAAGAKWPASKPDSRRSDATDTKAPRKHWAYIAPIKPQPPAVKTVSWSRTGIDRFILDRLEREHLQPSPEADLATLLRRVSLDLTGLPPTIAEADAFIADKSADAYDKVVDRLLASPRYGEKWAIWWLDLARYADSHGYEKDTARSMWAYRDWVINALNADMPFDRFTTEQLAGDLLPSPTTEQMIASAFNRNSMINEEGGVDPEEYRVAAVIDRTNTTATVWLGSTLACAQCHDHKYDPFTQKDYYSLSAFFNNTPAELAETPKGEIVVTNTTMKLPDPREAEWNKELASVEADIKAITDDKSPDLAPKKARADALRKQIASLPTIQIMKELDPPRKTHILQRGSFLSPGEEVSPNTPEELPAFASDLPRNRLGLAKWLMDPQNPLTARVTVNRIWAQYFGAGLVATDEDLGTRGERPTNPELLDHLATQLIANHWSLKALHRQIVTSAAYRQSSSVTPELLEKDPANRLLARGPRIRLDAELIRDQALFVAGLLSIKMHGPSVFPKQSPGIWSTPYDGTQWTDSQGEDAHRRSVYTFWKRSTPYPAFVAFDAPSRSTTCTRRPRTNTPLQALTTLNDPVFMEAAAALAHRVLTESGPSPDARLTFAFRAVLTRAPTATESARLTQLYQQQLTNFTTTPAAAHDLLTPLLTSTNGLPEPDLAAWTIVANVLLNLDEALTKG